MASAEVWRATLVSSALFWRAAMTVGGLGGRVGQRVFCNGSSAVLESGRHGRSLFIFRLLSNASLRLPVIDAVEGGHGGGEGVKIDAHARTVI